MKLMARFPLTLLALVVCYIMCKTEADNNSSMLREADNNH